MLLTKFYEDVESFRNIFFIQFYANIILQVKVRNIYELLVWHFYYYC